MYHPSSLKFSAFFLWFVVSATTFALNVDYPKSPEEKLREYTGSILGDKGLVYSSHSTPSANSSRNNLEDNYKHLWQAAIEVMEFAPLISVDYKSGIIITDWIADSRNKNYRTKYTILIKGSEISSSSLKVIKHREKLVNGQWVQDKVDKKSPCTILQKIVATAAELVKSNK